MQEIKKMIVKTQTAHNRRYTLRRREGGSGSVKPQSGFALCTVLSPPQFGQGTFASQSPITCPNRRIPRTLGASFANMKVL